MTEQNTAKQIKEATLTPVRVNPYTLPPDQHGWRGVTIEGAPRRKIYTVLYNEQVLVTALLRFPGETGAFGSRHYHDSGELSVRFEVDGTPIVGWSPPGEPHLHAPPPNPAAELREALRKVTEDGSIDQDGAKLAAQLGQLLQVPALGDWLEGLFRPEPRLSVAIDILFPPFTTYVPLPSGEMKKVVGQWYD